MVPKGWEILSIGDLGDVITGSTPKTSDLSLYGGDIPFVGPADLGRGKPITSAIKTLSDEGFQATRKIRKGATLFTCIGSTIGKIGFSGTALATNQQINAVVPNKLHDDNFIYHALKYRASHIAKLAGTQAVPIINKSTFSSQPILVSPLPEQKKIAQILSTWDQAITATERLLENSQQRKKGLMQKLLTGKKRLPGFEEEWKKIELGEALKYQQPTPFLVRSTEYSNDFPTPVLTAGKSFLLGYSDEEFGIYRDVLPTIIFDDFTTASRFVDFPFKVKSSAIKILTSNLGFSNRYIFEAMQMIRFKVGGHQRHWISIFANLVIPCPSFEEQKAISKVLATADHEILALQNCLKSLKKEKKALMQQLLTGKRRVQVEAE
jgi:type I restriction enzyme S subunit